MKRIISNIRTYKNSTFLDWKQSSEKRKFVRKNMNKGINLCFLLFDLWRNVCPAQRYIWRNGDTSTSSSHIFCGSSALPHNLLLKVEWIKQNLLVLQTLEVGGNPEILYSMSTTSRQLSWLSSAFSLIFELWCTFSGIIVENKTSHDYQSQPIFTISFRYIPNIGIHEGLRMCIIINDKSARWNTADIRKNLLIKPL